MSTLQHSVFNCKRQILKGYSEKLCSETLTMSEKNMDFLVSKEILEGILKEIHSLSGCQSVGIRLLNNGDYPY